MKVMRLRGLVFLPGIIVLGLACAFMSPVTFMNPSDYGYHAAGRLALLGLTLLLISIGLLFVGAWILDRMER